MQGAIDGDDSLDRPLCPPLLPSQLSSLRHYIPVLTRSITPECSQADMLPAQSPLRRPAGICLNVNSLPDMYADDGTLRDSDFLLQISPASVAQSGYNGASPTSQSALFALRQFLPSNFDQDGGNTSQYDLYSGDEFRMYEFKVRRCMRGRSHDWTECPFAHPGEKARRRDPRRYHYSGAVCTEYKKGSCKKGDACDLAHGVFECWLHPTRYRTQPCKDGCGCRRRICFFAHTPDQLRLVSPAMSSPSPSSSPSPTFTRPTSVDAPLEAFDLSGSSTSIKLGKGSLPLSESLPLQSSSPRPDALRVTSLSPRRISFDMLPCESPISSPHEGPRDLGLGAGLPTFRMSAVPASGEFCQSFQFNRSQATVPPNLLERKNPVCPVPLQMGSRSPLGMSPLDLATQKVEDLVRLMRQLDLAQHQEPVWQEGKGSMLYSHGLSPRQCVRSVPVTPTTKFRNSDGVMFNGGFFDDEEVGEPRLERVESGKRLRAEIFESLLSSTNATGY